LQTLKPISKGLYKRSRKICTIPPPSRIFRGKEETFKVPKAPMFCILCTKEQCGFIIKDILTGEGKVRMLKLFVHLCFISGAFSAFAMEHPSEGIEEALGRIRVDAPQPPLDDLPNGVVQIPLRILTIDDSRVNLIAMKSMLKRLGYTNVTPVNSAAEALTIIKDKAEENIYFDMIFTDIRMPGMDAIECAKEIRKIPRMKSVPIIAVTTEEEREIREECLKSGINGFMPKPFAIAALKKMLDVKLK